MSRFQSISLFSAAFAIAAALTLRGDEVASGLEAFRNRDFAGAERIFQRLTREHPANARAWKLLGMAYAGESKFTMAEPAFRMSCQLDPSEESACFYLARTEFTLGRTDHALRSFELALKTAGHSRGRVLLGIALAYESLSKLPDAEQYYRQAIEAGEARAKIDYGLFLFKNGRGAEGLTMLREAGAIAEAGKVEQALKGLPGAEPSRARPAAHGRISFASTVLPTILRNGALGKKHLIETMAGGVGVLDFDNDGWPDIFVTNGANVPDLIKTDSSFSNRLFRNNSDGTFSDVTAKAGVTGSGFAMGVAAADFDNDGNVDLFVTGVRRNTLFRNRGDGTFEDITEKAGLAEAGKWSVAAGWFDFDNDGLLDLFVVRYVAWDPKAEIFCGKPSDPETKRGGYRQYCHPSHYPPLANALYRNLGNGTFQDVSVESGISAYPGKGMGVVFGDFDHDGRLDVFVANDTVPNFLFHNEGKGKFRDIALEAGVAYGSDGNPISAMGADFRDFDNDGREDLFMTALSNETFPLFRNLGAGRFADLTYPSGIGTATLPWSGWSTGLFDFNNDGWKDIFTAGGHVMDNAEQSFNRKSRQPNVVFKNEGNGHFTAEVLEGEALHRGAAFADFDRDGRIDVVVSRLNESPLVLRNTTVSDGHSGNWIEYRLVGSRSNRDGIGARLHVVSESGEQWNRVTTSVGYGSSSDRTVHFGLGRDTRVTALEIEWPSGARQTLRDMPAKSLVMVKEPGERDNLMNKEGAQRIRRD